MHEGNHPGSALADQNETMRRSRSDARPKLPEPPPVTLVSVQDVRLPTVAGLERLLDEFYAGLLRFERVAEQAPGDPAIGPI